MRITSRERPEYCDTGKISKVGLLPRMFAAGREANWTHIKAVGLAEKRKPCCFAQRLQSSKAFQPTL